MIDAIPKGQTALAARAIMLGDDPGLGTSPCDGTALIAAAHPGPVEGERRLIGAGAPLDHINTRHWTAMMEAVALGDGGPDHLAGLDARPTAGADRTLADRDGATPLDHTEGHGYTETVARLKRSD